MKAGLAQLNTTVGDLQGNFAKIVAAYREAVGKGAEIVLTPELAITGYPPQDLVFKSRFVPLNLEMLDRLHAEAGAAPLVVGFIDRNDGPGAPFRNAAAVLQKGEPVRKVYKSLLPTYDVFDEDRYFEPATEVETVRMAGRNCGLTICEDVWVFPFLPRRLYPRDPVRSLVIRGAEIIFNISASPFTVGKPKQRLEMLGKLAAENGRPLVYCNAPWRERPVGIRRQFAGVRRVGPVHRAVAGVRGVCPGRGPWSRAHRTGMPGGAGGVARRAGAGGLRDYAVKCGFKSVVLGLSGGIDSAVTAAIAAEALGPDAVHGVTMPTQFSSGGSMEDSRLLARSLGIHFYHGPDPTLLRDLQGAVPRAVRRAAGRIPRKRTCSPGSGR